MYQIGVTPFEGDIIGLIDNLIKFGALECGRKLQIVMTKNAPLSYPIYNRFLRLYFACASFKDVSEFKGAIPLQLRYNEASSSIYLESNMRSAHGESVKKALDHMISKKRVISAKQMNYALKALSYSGKREEMFELFDTMKEKYNVEPTSMHHTSVVEAFANSQDFEKAEELATAFRLNEWESLMVMLNACKISANVERAEKYYQKLLSIDPLHAKPHLLMLDVKNCSSLDMYKIMDEKGIELPKLTARTTVNGIGFEFTDGSITSEQQKDAVSYWNDYLHPYCHEIGLLQVSSLLVPNVAVAHALSAKDDTEESVVVTLDGTMCLHDHQIIASISSVTGTEIIINETNRIHKFKNGQCICKNCW
jgi:tetratricopeptide (TPR) repeat protein